MRNLLSILAFVMASCLWATAPADAEVDASTAKEYQIKAAFLYNFVKFIDWPGEKSLNLTHAANICILGTDPFGSALDIFKQASSSHLMLNVQRDVKQADMAQCNILFISGSEQAAIQEILIHARSLHVLTVSEISGFADNGGIIEMVKTASAIGLFSKDKINLRINVKNAEAQNLHIDPQLLEIAAEVIK